jgi:tetratricopeptide (TPR) repeat protein
MGNLESACGNFEKGMEFFQRAISIRKASGDEAASLLANSYLSLARLHFLRREYDLAFNVVAKSEGLISRAVGR